jgi:alpha-tubulin suppressor-like RCC1 family protein
MRRQALGMLAAALVPTLPVLASCTALLGIDGPYRGENDAGPTADSAADGSGEGGPSGDAPLGVDGADAGPVDAGQIIAVTAGRFYSCALYTGGVAKCWGQNLEGEFGNGTAVSTAVPVPAMGTGLTALFGGLGDTCAVAGDAGQCSGRGGAGQLDNGQADAQSTVPVSTTALPAAPVAFASGQGFTCAMVIGGDVYCAGDGALGVLGNGSTAVQPTPVKVNLGGAPAMAIAAQWQHACAVTTAGDVFCWGDDSAGQLGNGTTTDAGVAAPVHVTLGAPAREVGVGEAHTCAIVGPDNDDGVWCWGDDTHGQLGSGGGSSSTPVQVQGLGIGLRSLAVGGEHTCVVLANAGGVACWGKGGSGELGNNDTHDSPTPVSVSSIGGAPVGLASGGFHTCALVSSPNVLCWGANDFGQLGNDDPLGTQQNTPVPVHF